MTFKATLFTKENCGPCFRVKQYVKGLAFAGNSSVHFLNTLKKENHPALVAAFDLNIYPTLVISNGPDMVRKFEGSTAVINNLLDELHMILLSLGKKEEDQP